MNTLSGVFCNLISSNSLQTNQTLMESVKHEEETRELCSVSVLLFIILVCILNRR